MNEQTPTESAAMLEALRGILGESLTAVYLHGSAVFGGLMKDSDIDFLAVANDELSDGERSALTDRLLEISGKIGNIDGKRYIELTIVKQSDIVPWRYPPRSLYQYGEWLREDIEGGRIPQAHESADMTIILSQAQHHSVTLFGADLPDVVPPIPRGDMLRATKECLPGLLGDLAGDERNVLLTLARMWATAGTGEFMPKDKAAEWAASRLPEEFTAPLTLAKSAYRDEEPDRWDNIDLTAIVVALTTKIEEALAKETGM